MVFGGRTFGRSLVHDDETLLNWISAFYKGRKRPELSFFTMWGNQEEGPYQSSTMLAPWSQTSQPPEIWEVNVHCLSHATNLWYSCCSSPNCLKHILSTVIFKLKKLCTSGNICDGGPEDAQSCNVNTVHLSRALNLFEFLKLKQMNTLLFRIQNTS